MPLLNIYAPFLLADGNLLEKKATASSYSQLSEQLGTDVLILSDVGDLTGHQPYPL